MTPSTYLTDIANAVSFSVSILTIFSLLYFYFTQDVYFVVLNVYIVFIQCAIDIFIWHTNSSVIHHICVLTFIYNFFSNRSDSDLDECIYIIIAILSTEISTLFLVIKLWMDQLDLKHSMWYTVNILVFFVTFVITRIGIFTTYVILNPLTYELELSNYVYLGLYGLFALNIYWLMLMFKVMLKPLKHSLVNSSTELFLKYGQFVNVAIVTYFNFDLSLNLMGAILVAVTSFSTYSLFLSSDRIGNSLFCFLNQVAFHFKSLFVVFSYLGTSFGQISLLCHYFFLTFTLFILIQHNSQFYFDGKTLMGLLLGVLCIEYYTDYYIMSTQVFGLILSFTLIFYSFPIFYLTETETMLIPVILDAVAVIYSIPSMEMKICFGVISYVMVVAIYVKPLYSHNLVLLYVLSFVQTYVLCQLHS